MKDSGSRWALDEPDQVESPRRLWSFRLVAVLVPSLVGIIAIIALMAFQGRIVVDPQTHWIRFQTPPLYLQEPGHQRTGHKYVYDELLGWRNIPSWSATTNGQPLTINSRGLRGPDYSFEKRIGTRRIVVLGDSFTWGYGVADDDVFSRVLERQLVDTGSPWQVINTGVSGWGTDQEYLFFINDGARYEPDIVILALFLKNDPANNSAGNQYGLNKPVFLDLQMKLGNVPVPKPQSESPLVQSEAPQVELTVEIIRSLEERCREQRSELVVMKFGRFHASNDPKYQPAEQQFEELRAERLSDVLYLDLDNEFSRRSVAFEQLLVGNDDGHWNAAGHRIVAEILYEFLTRHDVLSD